MRACGHAQLAQEPIFVAAHHLKDPSDPSRGDHPHRGRGRNVAGGAEAGRRSRSPERAAAAPGSDVSEAQLHEGADSQTPPRAEASSQEGHAQAQARLAQGGGKPTYQSQSLHLIMTDGNRGPKTAEEHPETATDNQDNSEPKPTEAEQAEMMKLFLESLRMGCIVEAHADTAEGRGVVGWSNSRGETGSGGSERCDRCKGVLKGGSVVELGPAGRMHKKCFTCVACSVSLVGVLWKGDWMQPGSTYIPRSEGIYCLCCFNAQFGPNCSGCGTKLVDEVFSVKGTIYTYCSEACRCAGGRNIPAWIQRRISVDACVNLRDCIFASCIVITYTLHIHTHTCSCVYSCMHICMHACVYICMHACMHVFTNRCT